MTIIVTKALTDEGSRIRESAMRILGIEDMETSTFRDVVSTIPGLKWSTRMASIGETSVYVEKSAYECDEMATRVAIVLCIAANAGLQLQN